MENIGQLKTLLLKADKNIPSSFRLRTHTKRQLNAIDENSSLGEQIKYYRMLEDIRQVDLAQKIGVDVSVLKKLENKESKEVNLELITSIIEELDIQDKVKINDDYIKFLLDNPAEQIKTIRTNLGMNKQEFADLLGVYRSSVKKWENGKTRISRRKYNILQEKIKENMK